MHGGLALRHGGSQTTEPCTPEVPGLGVPIGGGGEEVREGCGADVTAEEPVTVVADGVAEALAGKAETAGDAAGVGDELATNDEAERVDVLQLVASAARRRNPARRVARDRATELTPA